MPPRTRRPLSSIAKCAIAAVVAAASGFGFGEAVFKFPISPINTWATVAVKFVVAQFLGTIGAVLVFILVLKVLAALGA